MKKRSVWSMVTIFVLLLLGFSTLTYHVGNGGTNKIDQYVLNLFKSIEFDFLTTVMKVLSFIGDTIPVMTISIILLFVFFKLYKKTHEIILFIIVITGSTVLNQSLKFLLKRGRPIADLVSVDGFSYPSGHTMAAVSLYGIITYIFWRHIKIRAVRLPLIVLSTLMIFLISFSRIYLGVHYPSDVLGAFLVSGAWLCVTICFYQHLMDNYKS